MGAQPNNQNAVKDEEESASSFLHIRATRGNKAAWVRAAIRNKKKLSEWVTDALNEAAR